MTLFTPTTEPPNRPPAVRRSGRRRSRTRRVVTASITILVLGAAAAVGWAWRTGSIGGVEIFPQCTATALGSSAALDPEQAGNAAIIAAVAVRRGLPARAATIGIATAMQESKLYNVSGGDRDSIGLFQQRPSQGWGTVAQVHDPVYASNAFYDVLVKIEGYQNLPITTAAQRVQRSAFPSAYAAHEPEARVLASGLSGYSPGGLSCVLDPLPPGAASTLGPDHLTPLARALASAAQTETGRTGVPVTGSDGRRLRFDIAGSDQTRLSWSLAQWAVARADGLEITAVQVAGRLWQRDASADGWTTLSDGPPAGTVVVEVG
jgi:hypothetical protein